MIFLYFESKNSQIYGFFFFKEKICFLNSIAQRSTCLNHIIQNRNANENPKLEGYSRKAENPWKLCSLMEWWFEKACRCGGSADGYPNCVRCRGWPVVLGKNPWSKGNPTPVRIESLSVSTSSVILPLLTSFDVSLSFECDAYRQNSRIYVKIDASIIPSIESQLSSRHSKAIRIN